MSAEERCYPKSKAIGLVRQLGLHETKLGIPKGSLKQYRDAKQTNSYHAREYEGAICLHLDYFNPEECPLEHFVHDVLNEKTVAGAAIGFTAGYIASRGNWKLGLFTMFLGGLIGNAAS